MSKKEEFYFTSRSEDVQIHAVRYIPKGEVKAILQISHGMVEYIERYEDFAFYLNSRGILVTGNDHLGHGGSINSKEDYGYFSQKDGNKAVLYDLRKLTCLTREAYPGIPYFLLGHSMGSFYVRQYLCEFGQDLMLDGAIIMGTGFQPRILIKAGKSLAYLLALFKGWKYRCAFVDNMAFGSYNKRFKPARTSKDWLSKDQAKVDEYIADERCGFVFTLNAYYNMFCGMNRLYDRKFLTRMPGALPIFFVSGAQDPVGEFSKGVLRAVDSFQKAGMTDVKVKLYPDDRHEILNETDRQVVYQDIADWLESKSAAP